MMVNETRLHPVKMSSINLKVLFNTAFFDTAANVRCLLFTAEGVVDDGEGDVLCLC